MDPAGNEGVFIQHGRGRRVLIEKLFLCPRMKGFGFLRNSLITSPLPDHLGLYTDESPGLKVDPVVVLVLSLGFIFSVVALHGKSKTPPFLYLLPFPHEPTNSFEVLFSFASFSPYKK